MKAGRQSSIERFLADESGANAIEYGLIAALIAIGGIAAFATLGGTMSDMFNFVSNTAGGAMGAAGG